MPELVRTVGRYGIIRELGRGGMAVVYLARQVDLDRLVALKELAAFHAADADFARRFVRESRLAGSLVHPNVITVFDYFEHEGTPYIAMEYVDRGSLRPYVGRMTLAQIGGVLEGLLAGLAEAEQHNIVHRDLKPENLMVTSTGTVKIADFGIAKATQAADTGAFVTATGTTVGTPPYMAPEQAMAKDVGSWTDLYSVGCMAYELFTGKPPFYDADEPLAILLRHISEALPPAAEVADVDPEISAWIERLTSKDPKARPAVGDGRVGGVRGDPDRQARPAVAAGGAAARAGGSAGWRSRGAGRRGLGGVEHRHADARSGDSAAAPGPAPTIEGIDVEGTGPDTGERHPAAEEVSEEPAYETYMPPPSGPARGDRAAPPPPAAVEPEPVAPRARAAAAGSRRPRPSRSSRRPEPTRDPPDARAASARARRCRPSAASDR